MQRLPNSLFTHDRKKKHLEDDTQITAVKSVSRDFQMNTHLSRGAHSRHLQRRPAVCLWCSSSLATPGSCGCQTGPQSAPRIWWVLWTCSPSCAVDSSFEQFADTEVGPYFCHLNTGIIYTRVSVTSLNNMYEMCWTEIKYDVKCMTSKTVLIYIHYVSDE